jgi:hypothetical protein
MNRPRMLAVALSTICVFLCQAQAKPQGEKVAPSSGKQLCSALAPTDFVKVGVSVSALLEANVDDQSSAYCVYDSKAGKVEFDVFYPAGDTLGAAKGTEKTLLAEVGGKFELISLAGADSAQISLAVPGKVPSASIAVRKNLAVFTINLPQSAGARQQLLALAQIVLTRLHPQ